MRIYTEFIIKKEEKKAKRHSILLRRFLFREDERERKE